MTVMNDKEQALALERDYFSERRANHRVGQQLTESVVFGQKLKSIGLFWSAGRSNWKCKLTEAINVTMRAAEFREAGCLRNRVR